MSLSEIRVNTTKTRTGVGTITYTETGPVITGIATASNFKTGTTNVHSTGVELANINTGGSTATFGGPISGTSASFSGTVSIGGTLTYEDVTNIDAVGLVTARNGIKVLAGGANVVGVVTATSFVGALPISNDTNNRVLTGTGSGGINGESNLTFDHNQLFINCGNYSYPIVINSTQSSVRAVIRQTNDGNSNSGLAIQKKHSTLHPANHWYGDISFEGWDGSGYHKGGLIECVANGTPANDNMPGELRFSTNAGGTNPTKILTITKDGKLYHTGGGNGRRYSFASDGTSHYMKMDTTLNGIILNGYGGIAFETNGTNERIRIDSSGRLLINATATRAIAGGNSMLQIEKNSSELATFLRTSNDNGAAWLALAKSRSSAGAVCQAGDNIGAIAFIPHDGTDLNHHAAEIRAYVDTGIGANDTPGYLTFHTNSGAATTTERLRIKSGGEVRIGANSTTASTAGDDLVIEGSSDRGLSIIAGTSSSSNIYFGDSGDADIGRIAYQHNDNALDFSVNAGTTRVRIHSNGTYFYGQDNVFFGGTSGTNLNGELRIRSVGTAVYQHLRFTSSDGSSHSQIMGYGGGGILFRYSGTHVWAINSQGERLELTNTALSPRENATVLDLGTTAKRYRRTHTDAITVNTTNTNTKFCINGASSANVMTIRNTTGGNGNVGILFSTQDHSGGREKAAIYHKETHGQAHYGGDFTFCLANSTGSAGQVTPSDERMRVMRGGGISFKGETSNNNMLDYYEEGTFTPSYGGTHSGLSGNQRHARYTRIGNLVFYSLEYYNSSNAASWSSGFELGGMPYASSLSELYCSPSIGVMYGPGGYSMDADANGRTYHLGSQNKIYFKFSASGVRHLWIQFFHRVEN